MFLYLSLLLTLSLSYCIPNVYLSRLLPLQKPALPLVTAELLQKGYVSVNTTGYGDPRMEENGDMTYIFKCIELRTPGHCLCMGFDR